MMTVESVTLTAAGRIVRSKVRCVSGGGAALE
jgi:hypothetical protein